MTGSQSVGPRPWFFTALNTLATGNSTVLLIEPGPCPSATPVGIGDENIAFATLAAVDAGLLDRIRPDVVLAPLMTPAFDVLDLARLLSALGYRGQLRAVTPGIPDPRLVRREIAAACPGLDFELVVSAPGRGSA